MRYAYNREIDGSCDHPSRKEYENKLQRIFSLNSRYARDAILQAKAQMASCKELEINPKKVIFGSKKLFRKLKKRHLQTEELRDKYRESRQCNLYSRGETSRKGNVNLRIVGNQLRINVGNRTYIYADIHTRHKKWPLLLASNSYSVRLKRKGNKWYAYFSFGEELPDITTTLTNGAIGIDLNAFPSNIAWAETSAIGNYLTSDTINTHYLYDCRKDKRDWYVWHYARQITEIAKHKNKGVVIEDLSFGKARNRAQNNFCYRKLKQAIIATCRRQGVEVKVVNPAYTSIIGCVKYAPLYGLSRHTSAAFVIARRGRGYKEKLPKSFARRINRISVTRQKKEAYPLNKVFKYVYSVCKVAALTEHLTGKPKTNWSIFRPFVVSEDYSQVPKLGPLLGCGPSP